MKITRTGRAPDWHVWGVLLFTVLTSGLIWFQSNRSEQALKERVLAQAEQRSLQVAHAMAGQVENSLAAMGLTLRELRGVWQSEPPRFDEAVQRALRALPGGLVEQLTVVNAAGQVVYNSLGQGLGRSLADRDYFKDLAQGSDRLLISRPVFGRLTEQWLFVVTMPLRKDGRFDGTIQIVVPTARIAAALAKLQVSNEDSISLIHSSGARLGRSTGNLSGMNSLEPADRPYLGNTLATSGSFKYAEPSLADGHTVGWSRLQDGQATVVVDLADRSVLSPLEPALRQSRWVARLLIAMTVCGGLSIAWLLHRLGLTHRVLTQGAESLADAQQLAKVGNWRYGEPGSSLECSAEMQRILGVDLVGRQLSRKALFDRIHPDDRGMVDEQLARLGPELQRVEFEHRLLGQADQIKTLHVIASVEVADGIVSGVRGTVQDVSEAREAQRSLARLNQELEKRVRERTLELERSKREMDAFAYSVSHDLRAPLRGVQGFTALLAEESEHLTPEGRTYLRRVQESAGYMTALISDLLMLAQHSRAPIESQVVDLSDMALSVVNELRHSEPARQVACDIEPGLRAWCDPMLTRAVLQNLLGNAWKYTGRRENACIRFHRVEVQDGLVEFCVSDNGAGFDMKHASQLFQPFKRLHTRSNFEGTGVGLATVQRIVQRHGGDVRGEGQVGEGASFWFSLPELPVASATADPAQAAA